MSLYLDEVKGLQVVGINNEHWITNNDVSNVPKTTSFGDDPDNLIKSYQLPDISACSSPEHMRTNSVNIIQKVMSRHRWIDRFREMGELDTTTRIVILRWLTQRYCLSYDHIFMHYASLFGYLDLVEILCGRVSTRTRYKGLTPVMVASREGHLALVIFLVESGFPLHYTNKGKTAMILASYNGNLDIVQYLIDNLADVNYTNDRGETALMWATVLGKLGVVKMLVENGAKINSYDIKNEDALMKACKYGQLDVVKYLVGCGSNLRVENIISRNAITIASYSGSNNIVKYLIPYMV